MGKQVEQHIIDAIGTLVQNTLLNSQNVESGYTYTARKLHMGPQEYGSWTIEVKRLVKPVANA